MKLRTLAALLFCNLIWSANPAMAKIIMAGSPRGISPALTAWLRFVSALCAYSIAQGMFHVIRRSSPSSAFFWPRRGEDWFWLFLIGAMGFCFAPLLQMSGLHASRATDNALIVAMEPLVTVVLAWLILKETMSAIHVLAFFIALVGFGIVIDVTPSHLKLLFNSPGSTEGAHFFGNLLILLALVGEACYSIAGRKLLIRHSAPGIFGSALVVGAVLLTLVILIQDGQGWLAGIVPSTFASLGGLSAKGWLAVFFIGPLGTAMTYLYWMVILNDATVASLAVTLFIQPVFGSIWGYAFLDERLTFFQGVGAIFIFCAIALQNVTWPRRA